MKWNFDYFFQLACILRNPKRLKQTHTLQCMHDKHFASRIPAIWLQNVLDLHSAYLIILIVFPINKLKYNSHDNKGVKYHFKVSLFSYFSCQSHSVINLEKKTLKANKSIDRIVWVFWIWVFLIKYVLGDVLPHSVIVSPTQSRKKNQQKHHQLELLYTLLTVSTRECMSLLNSHLDNSISGWSMQVFSTTHFFYYWLEFNFLF